MKTLLKLGLITFFLMYATLWASDKKKKHSAIVEADGYAFLSEDKSIRDLRQEALSLAKREALEKGQTFIKSVTKIENFQMQYDLIETASEGAVKIIESKDLGVTQDNRYHYWIKAEIEYQIAPSSKEEKKVESASSGPLEVRVWTEKKTYKADQRVRICMKANKDFYAKIVYQDVEGNLLQVLPNKNRRDHFFRGGQTIKVPDDVDGFQLQVSAPFGLESVRVYASSEPLGDIATQPGDKPYYGIEANLKQTAQQTRAVKITEKSAEFFEASCEITTKAK